MIKFVNTNIFNIFNEVFGCQAPDRGDATYCYEFVNDFGECAIDALQMQPLGWGQIVWTATLFDGQITVRVSTNELPADATDTDIAAVIRSALNRELMRLSIKLSR